MFKIIDEKMGLASCSLSDLTMQQVHDFLWEWEEGASIGILTLYYDEVRNVVVLNQDNENYELYLQIAQAFMEFSEEQRSEYIKKAPESMANTLTVLNSAIERMEYCRDLNRLKYHNIPPKYMRAIDYIRHKEKDCWAFVYVFMYGLMCGKREERARRNGGAAV